MANKIDILIKAKDEASKEIDKVKKSLDGMGTEGGESTENLGFNFDSLVGVITAGAAIAAAAATALKVALDFSEEGAQIARLQDTSAMLASSMGFDMDEIVAAVSAASLHTVSDMDIMASASKAMMLGVGSSAEEMASLMEVAAIRGRALGLDTTEAFDQIVRGIGRLSPKILDNLGIIVDADVTYAAYAESIGKFADELTEMEKRQALVNAVIADTAPLLKEAGGLTEDSASAWEEMSAAQKNYWDKMKSNASDLMVWWPEFWAAFYRAMTPPEKIEADVIDVMGKLNEAMLAGIIDETTYNAVLGDVNNALMSNGEALAFVAEKTAEVRDANVEASNSYQTQLESIWAASESYEQFLSSVEAAGIELNLIDEASWAAGKAELELAGTTKTLSERTQEWADANYEGEAAANAASAAVDKMQLAAAAAALAQEKLNTKTTTAIFNLGEKYTPILEEIAIKQERIVELNQIEEKGGGYLDGVWVTAKKAAEEAANLETEIQNARIAMEGLAAQAVAGIAWGQITADGKVSLEEITRYYDYLVQTGIMSAEAGKQAIQDFMEYWGLWDPESKELPVEVVLDTSAVDLWDAPAKYGRVYYSPSNPIGQFTEAAGGAVHAAATGLAATLPHYWVGELGPEPFFPAQNGRIVSNTQALAALRGGAGADSVEIANAVKRGVKEAMKEANGGNVYNLTMPTSSNPADVKMAFELMEAWA